MLNVRIIPKLDIKGPNLVKGIHLEGLRVLGKPEDFAKYYYENGADELIYMDVVASLYDRNSLDDIIKKTAKEIFIPLTVGGGIRSIEDITKVLRAGADKVSLNTAAIRNPDFITKAAKQFGSSTIVVSIEAIKQGEGNYLCFVDNGREHTGIEAIEWAKKAEALGAGEILITSVDNEGTGMGYDIELIKKISNAVSIPIIAHGGPGNLNHIKDAVTIGEASAIAISSMFHYDYVFKNNHTMQKEMEGNTDFLKSGKTFSKIINASIPEVKNYLIKNEISCRPFN